MTTKTLREMVRHWHDRGEPTESISRILHMPIQEVRDIITHPEPDEPTEQTATPTLIQPTIDEL